MRRDVRRRLREQAYKAHSAGATTIRADVEPAARSEVPTESLEGLSDQEKLSRRRIEEDTRILSERFVQAGDVPILLENWKWVMEGISGTTAVLLTAHVADLDDGSLMELVELTGAEMGEKRTITRGSVHTFVNFGFQVAD